jgi:hypothetical protein
MFSKTCFLLKNWKLFFALFLSKPETRKELFKMSGVQNVVVDAAQTKKPRGRKTKADPTVTELSTDGSVVASTEGSVVASTEGSVVASTEGSVEVVKKSRGKKPKVVVKEGGDLENVVKDTEGAGEIEKEKKPRKPSLPAKFSKFIHFGLFLMGELNDDKVLVGEPPLLDEAVMLEKLNVFADVEQQTAFVQKFFDGLKDTAKGMRKMIADKKKADKKADKKEAVTKESKSKGKAKATKDTDLVAELVTLANDAKPKRKYNKKPKIVDTIPTSTPLDEQPTAELEVDLILVDGVQYLCDDQQRLFDFVSHKPCGILSNGIIIPL